MLLKKLNKISIVGACLVALSGCGVDDVQFNGKVFDAMGMNTSSVKKEATLKERAPLVVPPGVESLPEPGSGKLAQPALADIQDYDEKRTVNQGDLERQQAEYCDKNYTQAKVHGDRDVDLAVGPLGPCRGSVLTAVKKINSEETEE